MTPGLEIRCSIQLSYGDSEVHDYPSRPDPGGYPVCRDRSRRSVIQLPFTTEVAKGEILAILTKPLPSLSKTNKVITFSGSREL